MDTVFAQAFIGNPRRDQLPPVVPERQRSVLGEGGDLGVEPRYAQRVARFNAEIAALAENRALPLWNYWRQLVAPGVPDEGLGEDGVHPSAQGYALRNFGALRVLDLLRRSVPLGDGS